VAERTTASVVKRTIAGIQIPATGGIALCAGNCLDGETALRQPGMAETYGSQIEILPN